MEFLSKFITSLCPSSLKCAQKQHKLRTIVCEVVQRTLCTSCLAMRAGTSDMHGDVAAAGSVNSSRY